MRQRLSPNVRDVRTPIKTHLTTASPPEATPLALLDNDATGIITALPTYGQQPFTDATVEAAALVEEIEESLQRLAHKGGQ